MKKRIIAIVAIILAVIIAALAIIFTLSQCDGGKKVVQIVVVPDDENSSDDNSSDDTSSDDTDQSDDDPYMSDDISLDNGFSDNTVYNPSELYDEDLGEVYILNANNNTEGIATTLYRGMTGAVYWGTEFLDQNVYNQSYTQEMIDLEFRRFRDLGLRVLRTGFWSDFMWTGDPENPWNTDTPEMHNFFDFCRAAAEYDLIVAPVMCWSYTNFVMGGGQYLSEIGYMYPRLLDEDGNPTLVTRWGNYFYEPDVELMNERYGSWVATAAQAFIDNGLDNVQFFFFGNEPHEDGGTATGAFVDYQIGSFSAAHEALVKAGIRDRFQIIGANQSVVTDRAGLAQAFMDRAPDVFDIYSSHTSPRGASSVEDIYDKAAYCYDGWMEKMDIHELRNVKEFWCDEFSGNADIFGDHGTIDEWAPIWAATRYIAVTNSGISGANFWEIFDQLWPGYYGSGGEYMYGVQMDGAAKSLYEGEEPYPMLYGMSLFTRYMGSNMKGVGYGTSYRCAAEDDSSGLYITMVDRGDGETSIIVCNASTDPRSYQINIAESLGGKTMYRYFYSAGKCETATNFTLPTADKGYTNVENVIVDSVPAGSIAVYSTIKNIAD